MSATGRPRTACNQCNAQKLRCSGDKPNCQRCLRLGRSCVYGNHYARRRNPTATPHPESSCSTLLDSSSYGQSYMAPSTSPPPLLGLPEKSYIGIPAALLEALVEIYFSHVYNASLLLHESRFKRAMASQTVPPHVVLSVCALASNFYEPGASQGSLNKYGFGPEWAERATGLVLQMADEPCDENIVTFLNLTLFWYSQGSWRRAAMHKGNGIQTAQVLGLDFECTSNKRSLDREIQRRLFWACFITNLFNSETCFVIEPSERVLNLALPCHDEDFEAGSPKDDVNLSTTKSNGSIHAELVKVMILWSAVHTFIKRPESDPISSLTALQALDTRIRKWRSDIPPSLELTPATIPRMSNSILPRLLLIHVVYHQCLCALHSSIVPLFTASEVDQSWGYAIQMSAQVAYDHSSAACTLLNAALNHLGGSATFASFIAYAAYCSCAIQMPFLWCKQSNVKKRAQANVRDAIQVISSMAKYWKFSALLGIHVRQLYAGHAKNNCPIDNEPKYADVNKLTCFRSIATHARDSILGHTKILWSQSGAFAQQGKELADLDAQHFNPLASPPIEATPAANARAVDATQSSDSPGLYTADAIRPLAPFQPYIDPSILNLDHSFFSFLSAESLNSDIARDEFQAWLGSELAFDAQSIV